MKVLITEPEDYNEKAIALYSGRAEVCLLRPSEPLLDKNIADVDVLVIRLKFMIDRTVIDAAPRLKYIISPTTGLDHIDEQYAQSKGIRIISLKEETGFLETIPSTAELTWGLLLALVRKIPFAFADVVEGNWNRQSFRGNNLKNMKLGILGLGRVGRQVAKYAAAFDMKVMAFDPYRHEWLEGVEKAKDARELLEWCDVLIIHIPASGNEKYLSADLLRHLKKTALIINTSRGSVWDEEEIVNMLLTGRLRGVATDVLSEEMDEDKIQKNPLIMNAGKLRNLIITPHIAGATFESMQATEEYVARKFIETISI